MKIDKAIRITLNEVKYDVKFESWKTDKVASQANGQPIDLAYDNDKAEDWLIRQIHDAISQVYSHLGWCVHDDADFATDEILRNPEEWVVHLRFSRQWDGSIRAMTTMLHDYVRDYVLSRWYMLAQSSLATTYAASAENHLNRLYNEARSEKVSLEPWRL